MEGHCCVVVDYLSKITNMLYLSILCERQVSVPVFKACPYSEMKPKESQLTVQSSSLFWVSC
jgi:hypothetical protein